MNKEDIENRVKILLAHSEQYLEVESPKIDFKLKWYDFKKKSGISEFIKDTTAIANTVGTDGFIIIGFDDKRKIYQPATFNDSGLRDTSDIPNLIVRNCSNLFDIVTYDIIIKNNKLSVIHIPPTLEKPIVILNHQTYKRGTEDIKNEEQHRIFIRKNTRTYPASKNDLELMYYDRKNIEPEYQYSIDLLEAKCYSKLIIENRYRPNVTKLQNNFIEVDLTIENFGKRTIAIKTISITLESDNKCFSYDKSSFSFNGLKQMEEYALTPSIKVNEVHRLNIIFHKIQSDLIDTSKFKTLNITFILTNDKVLIKKIQTSDLKIIT